MSEPVLVSADTEGAVRIEEIGPTGMIVFRGDLEKPEVRAALEAVTRVQMPEQRRISLNGERGLGWMAPDELLVLVPRADVTSALVTIADRLAGHHTLAVDMSDARAVFRISGPQAREVLAKLSPVDLLHANFRPWELRRTRAAQVAAAFWVDDSGAFTLICFRSVARYMHDILLLSAQPGTDIGLYPG